MILFTLPPKTFTAGEEVIFGPFPINDNVLSLMVETDQFAASASPCLEARLERKISATEWEVAGSYGIGARTVTDRMNWARVGLYPGTNRQFRVIVKVYETVTTGARIYNSVTLGTPGSAQGFSASGSVAVDAGSGSDRCMVGCFGCSHATPGPVVLTYNSLSTVSVSTSTAANNSVRMSYQVAPAIGSHTLAHSGNDTGGVEWFLVGLPLAGVDSSSSIGTPVTGSGSASPIGVNITDSATDDLIADVVSKQETGGGSTLTANSPQVEQYKQTGYGGSGRDGGVSTKAGASGTQAMAWTTNQSSNWCQVAVNFKQAVAFAGNPPKPVVLAQAVKQSFSW